MDEINVAIGDPIPARPGPTVHALGGHLVVVEHDPELALASIIPLCDCAGCEDAVQRIAKALETND